MGDDFLILHGLENHRPPQHWQFLLAAALVERGHHVRYPALPDPDNPSLEAWLTDFRRELSSVAAGRVSVVCHSLSCLLWLHAASRSIGPLDRVLLVAPPASEALPDTAASFRIGAVDPARVLAAARSVTIVASDDDPYNPPGAQRRYADPLGLTVTMVPGGGHLTPDDGYGPWPWVLDWCLADTR